jgi:RIO kinase 1
VKTVEFKESSKVQQKSLNIHDD